MKKYTDPNGQTCGDAPNAWWFARMAARVEYHEHWDQQHSTRPAPVLEER